MECTLCIGNAARNLRMTAIRSFADKAFILVLVFAVIGPSSLRIPFMLLVNNNIK